MKIARHGIYNAKNLGKDWEANYWLKLRFFKPILICIFSMNWFNSIYLWSNKVNVTQTYWIQVRTKPILNLELIKPHNSLIKNLSIAFLLLAKIWKDNKPSKVRPIFPTYIHYWRYLSIYDLILWFLTYD
jgi:hypothetical protein